MKFVTAIATFAVLFSTGYSFQCDSMFSGRQCGQYSQAQDSLNGITRFTDGILTKILKDINDETAKVFKNLLPKMKGLNNRVIHLDNHTKIIVNGNMTAAEALKIFSKLMKMLKDLEGLQLVGLKELEKINKMISDVLNNALYRNGNAYIILDKIDLQKIKDYIKSKLSGGIVSSLVRTAALKIIDRYHNRLETIGKYLKPLLDFAGYGQTYEQIAGFIHAIIEAAKQKISNTNSAYSITLTSQIQKAEHDLITFIDGVDTQAPIVKRGIQDLWGKVQTALNNLGENIKKTATDLVNKYKPKVLDSLEKAKIAIVKGAKDIVLQIQGDIIKILTPDSN